MNNANDKKPGYARLFDLSTKRICRGYAIAAHGGENALTSQNPRPALIGEKMKIEKEGGKKNAMNQETTPTCEDLAAVANQFRSLLRMPLIDLREMKIPETGQPVTLESFRPSLDAWEQAVPGAKARIRQMAEREAEHRRFKEQHGILRGQS